MNGKTGKIILVFFGLSALINLLIVDLWVLKRKEEIAPDFLPDKPSVTLPVETEKEKLERETLSDITKDEVSLDSFDCSDKCQKLIEDKVRQEIAKIPTQPPAKTLAVVPTVTGNKNKIVYVPLVTEGTTASTIWSDILPSEFYFDLNDYPGVKEVRFVAYLQAVQGAAKIYARLYDQTNKRGIDYSDIETQSSSYTLVESSKMTIWQGNNRYTVQLKSLNGTQALLKEAKLKIIF